MADPVLELDAAASAVDGSNPGTSMLLVDSSTGWTLVSLDTPTPEQKLLWTSSIDMDGSLRADPGNYENRTITAQLACERSTAALLQAQLRILGTKIGKIAREGGTLKVTYPSGNTFIFDLLAGSHNHQFDHAFVMGNLAQVTVTFTALPAARGAEEDLGDNSEFSLPCLVFTETSIKGDVPALGRLLIVNEASVAQWWLTWGIESRYYSSSANAALFYQAEGRLALGSTTTAAGPSGASGAGSNVMRNTALLTSYQGIFSTQTTGSGAHLSHIGTFRVYARVQVPTTNTGTVTVALSWAEADFGDVTTNPATAISPLHEGAWRLVDLGMVTLRPVATGTQRWEGRFLARSTVAGDDIDIDYLLLVPVSEGSGIVAAVGAVVTPSYFDASDSFTSTTAGNALNARAAPAGGSWATSGDATDFLFSDLDFDGSTAAETLIRTPSSGTNGRFAVMGTSNFTDVRAEVSIQAAGTLIGVGRVEQGLLARWTDSSNHLRAALVRETTASVTDALSLRITQNIAGTLTVVASTDLPSFAPVFADVYLLRLIVRANGEATLALLTEAGAVVADATGYSAQLATGGTLATGEPGLWDLNTSVSSWSRRYDDFLVSTPPADAAMFPLQSLDIRHDRVIREDLTGAVWGSPGSYVGDYLSVPPAGAEGRTIRIVVKGSRLDPFIADSAIDDISAKLFVTPRYLNVPSA